MHIKLSSLAVASAATLVLAGCGGGDGGGLDDLGAGAVAEGDGGVIHASLNVSGREVSTKGSGAVDTGRRSW